MYRKGQKEKHPHNENNVIQIHPRSPRYYRDADGLCSGNHPPSFENDKVNPAAESSRVIAVSFGQQTKTTLEGFQPKFANKDSILISNEEALDTCEVKVDDKGATITTNLTGPLTAVYPYTAAGMNENNENEIDTVLVSTIQSGKFADANICMAKMTSENDESLSFDNKTAVFCIYPPAGKSAQYVEVSAEGFDIANDGPAESTHTIQVAPITADSVWVSILVPDGLKVSDLTFSDGVNEKTVATGDRADEKIAVNTLYTVTIDSGEIPEHDTPDGALKGVFTVGNGADGIAGTADDIKVHFSQGNLYCSRTSSLSSDWTWHFYNEQYQYNSLNSTMDALSQRFLNKDDTEIDLFTWGYDEEGSIDPKGTTHCSANTDCDFKREEDWGSQIGDGKTWRTLTADEWSYLIDKNKKRFAKVTVCGIYGIILFPDNFDGKNVVGGIAGDGTWANWENYKFDEEGWDALQKQGVVFLPNAGCRPNAQIVWKIGNEGYYWSSSSGKEAETAKCLLVNNYYVEIKEKENASIGCSVRLVTDVSAAPTPTEPTSEYVEIKALYNGTDSTTLKWYRQNLAITDSGNKPWKGGNESAVKVPGTNEDVVVGDYFQWAAHAGYCGNDTDADKGLLIYTSFTNINCVDGGAENKFNFKEADGSNKYRFHTSNSTGYIGISPYYSGSAYDTYTKTSSSAGDGKNVLDNNDDVASIILGDNWRMPTSAEFQAMKDATYWAWDGEDKGYYVFAPDESHLKGAQARSIPAELNKADALLFFPAAGVGNDTSLRNAGSYGYYWSSSLYTSNTHSAYLMYFGSDDVYPQTSRDRYSGYSIRPVSD